MAVEYRRVIMPTQTALEWLSKNTTLAAGEFGVERDTGKFKIGTGTQAWAQLEYAGAGIGGSKGEKGDDGLPGEGVPVGGQPGETLRKVSPDNYDFELVTGVFSDLAQAKGGRIVTNAVLITEAEYTDPGFIEDDDTIYFIERENGELYVSDINRFRVFLSLADFQAAVDAGFAPDEGASAIAEGLVLLRDLSAPADATLPAGWRYADHYSFVAVPAGATSPGKPGQTSYDSQFFYICTAADTWRRVAIAAW